MGKDHLDDVTLILDNNGRTLARLMKIVEGAQGHPLGYVMLEIREYVTRHATKDLGRVEALCLAQSLGRFRMADLSAEYKDRCWLGVAKHYINKYAEGVRCYEYLPESESYENHQKTPANRG